MQRVKYISPSAIAIVLSILVSVFLMERTVVWLICITVVMAAMLFEMGLGFHVSRNLTKMIFHTVVPVFCFVAVALPNVPLRIAFRIYRPEFDRISKQIEGGATFTTPFWIGPFRIKSAGHRGESGIPYLASGGQEWEIDGFVRTPNGDGFNCWSCIKLDDKWAYIAED